MRAGGSAARCLARARLCLRGVSSTPTRPCEYERMQMRYALRDIDSAVRNP